MHELFLALYMQEAFGEEQLQSCGQIFTPAHKKVGHEKVQSSERRVISETTLALV